MNNLFANVEIKGFLTFSQELLMEGRIEGDVSSTAPLTIGEHAFVKGTVNTRSVVVHGHVEGNITVQERCDVKSTATIIGNITAATFAIEAGATFCGHSQVKQAPSTPKNPQKPSRLL
ncbi:polymer-forming cytoskeletal protein [Prosthecobacter sp.]|uniref:polymer-forming cytoskeletal protein n=1 Tax=Prosthecobacter sp. TaxID=1965333 RepID=UPI003783005C